jgi:poly-gamma-glutamate synthesis protein (capsule biosynthesis protein)
VRPATSTRAFLAAAFCAATWASAACNADPSPAADPTIVVAPSVEAPTPAPTPEPVTRLLFTGDIIPSRCTAARIDALGGDYTLPFQALRDILAGADITIGTLDSTASDAGVPSGCVPTFTLPGRAAVVDGLRFAGFDVISHAANHIKDCAGEAQPCGDRAMLETHENLRAAGIRPVGAGRDLQDARGPVVIERNGMYFAFLAYDDIASYYWATATSPGSAPLDETTIAEDIANARKVAHVVIVLPQWGVEYTTSPSERQREVARVAAFAGADLIVGNHPHWVQAHEQIGDAARPAFVAYALGNFVFDQDWSLETQQGAMLEVTFTGARITGWRYLPVHIYDEYQPRLAGPEEAAQILERIEGASRALVPE